MSALSDRGRPGADSVLICKLCGEPVDNPRQAWKEQTGWVSPRGAKGMTQAHPTGALAHAECISLLRAGVKLDQQALL